MKKVFIFLLMLVSYTAYSNWISISGPNNVTKSMVMLEDKLFAGTYGSGVYYYDGFEWKESNTNLTNKNVWEVVTHKGDLYVSTDAGVFKSVKGTGSWTKISTFIGGLSFYAMTATDTKIFVSNENNNIYYTTNGGTEWKDVNTTDISYNIRTLAVNQDALFAGCENGKIYKTTNDGEIWNEINNAPLLFTVNKIKFVDTKIFVGTLDGGMFLTEDGKTWKAINNGLSSANITGVESNSTSVFISTKTKGVYYTNDNGATWNLANEGLNSIEDYSLYSDGRFLYTAGGNNEVYKRYLSEFGAVALEAPLLEQPANESSELEVLPYFSWEIAKGALFYKIQISENSDFSANTVDVENIVKGSYTVTKDLKYETTYFWRVASVNAVDEKKWSEARKFTTKKFVGVEETNPEMIKFYPNPVSNFLVVNTGENQISYLQIYDLNGQLVKNYFFGLSSNFKINLEELTNGSYLVVTEIGGQVIKKKFVKSN